MAIRDRFNRMLRKPASSTATAPTNPSAMTMPSASPVPSATSPGTWNSLSGISWTPVAPASSSPSSAASSPGASPVQQHQPQWPLRDDTPLPFRPAAPAPKQQSTKRRSKKRSLAPALSWPSRPHPTERPLTQENQRYQEVFASFTMQSPGSSPSSTRASLDGEVSPCCSRRGSLDGPLPPSSRGFHAY